MDQLVSEGHQVVTSIEGRNAYDKYEMDLLCGNKSSKIRALIKLASLAKSMPADVLVKIVILISAIFENPPSDSSFPFYEAAVFCIKHIALRLDGNLPAIIGQTSIGSNLLKLLPNSNRSLQIVLLKCLRNVALSAEGNRVFLTNNGGLELVLDMCNTCDGDIRMHLLELLNSLALSIEVRRDMMKYNGLRFLVESVKLGSMVSKTRAAHVIGLFGLMKRARKMIVEVDAIPALIGLIKESDNISTKLVASNALGVISSHVELIRPVAEAGAVPLFVNLFEEPNNVAREISLDVFSFLSTDKNLAVEIASEMVRILKGENIEAKPAASRVLWDLSGHRNAAFIIRNSHAIPVIVNLLREENDFTREHASGAVSNLSYNGNDRIALAKAGAIPVLHDLLNDESGEVRDNVTDALICFSEDPLLRDQVSEMIQMPFSGNYRSTTIQNRDPNVHVVRALREMSLEEVVTWDVNFV